MMRLGLKSKVGGYSTWEFVCEEALTPCGVLPPQKSLPAASRYLSRCRRPWRSEKMRGPAWLLAVRESARREHSEDVRRLYSQFC